VELVSPLRAWRNKMAAEGIELASIHSKSSSDDSENEIVQFLTDKSTTELASPQQVDPKDVGLKKQLTLFNLISIIIGQIVGAGIFIAATRGLQYSGSFGLALVYWTIGGIIAIAGGLSYVELNTLIKNSGGEYAYLKEAYSFNSTSFKALGNVLSFTYSWTSILIMRPASSAVVLLTFGQYFAQAVAMGATPVESAVKILAIAAIVFISVINMYSVRLTALFINVTTVFKIVALLFIGCLGLWELYKGEHLDNFTNVFEGSSFCIGDIALAMYSVLWAYDGWNALSYSVEECKDSEKNVPRGIMIGLPIVIVCYLFVNVAYFAALSKASMLSSPATALTFGEKTLGAPGLVLFPLMVAVATLGATTGSVYMASRVVFATSRDGNFLEIFSGLHNTHSTPVPAILLQFSLCVFYILIGNISHLINGISSVLWVFYGLSFAGLLIMRITKRHERRPFKIWFIVPLFMILVSAFLVVVPIILVPNERPYIAVGLGIISSGVPVYFCFINEKFRPEVFNKISEYLTFLSNMTLNTSTVKSAIETTIS
jgi:amino acid transporter